MLFHFFIFWFPLISSNQCHDDIFQGELALFPLSPPSPLHPPSTEVDRVINKGWLLFLLYFYPLF